jgi:hypothetical protein
MSGKKWIMKQYWRVGTIRTLFSLILSMMVLGKYYYEYVPALKPLGLIGALILGTLLILLFLGLGYVYDVRLKLWNEGFKVAIERDPYQQAASLRTKSMDFPALYAFIHTMRRYLVRSGIETAKIDGLIQYYTKYFQRSATDKIDLIESNKSGKTFLEEHPFTSKTQAVHRGRNIGGRLKSSFQTQLLRIGYIQSFSGTASDVLTISALYAPILVGESAPNDLLLNIVYLISLPLFMLLVVLGWYYDKKLKMWGPEFLIRIERDPYSYVPEPRLWAVVFPFLFVYLKNTYEVMRKMGKDTSKIEKIISYFDEYSRLKASNEKDLMRGRTIRANMGNLWKQN